MVVWQQILQFFWNFFKTQNIILMFVLFHSFKYLWLSVMLCLHEVHMWTGKLHHSAHSMGTIAMGWGSYVADAMDYTTYMLIFISATTFIFLQQYMPLHHELEEYLLQIQYKLESVRRERIENQQKFDSLLEAGTPCWSNLSW
jgi:hypothetical protein